MDEELTYLDSSALVKLVVEEPETQALREWLKSGGRFFSSAIAAVEVPRAARRFGEDTLGRARLTLERVALRDVDDQVVALAATIEPALMRSLDAIHLATAMLVRDDLGAFVAYDLRLLRAARAAGLPTAAPGLPLAE